VERLLSVWREENRNSQVDKSMKSAWLQDVASRFKYRLKVQFHDRVEKKGARIEIQEVWGTSPKIPNRRSVRGFTENTRCPTMRRASYFYVTSEGNWPILGHSGTADLDRGERQRRIHAHAQLRRPGQFHVQLLADEGKTERWPMFTSSRV